MWDHFGLTTIKSHNSLHLFNDWCMDSTVSTHINAVLCISVPSAHNDRLPMKLASKVFDFIMDTPGGKRLVWAMQRM